MKKLDEKKINAKIKQAEEGAEKTFDNLLKKINKKEAIEIIEKIKAWLTGVERKIEGIPAKSTKPQNKSEKSKTFIAKPVVTKAITKKPITIKPIPKTVKKITKKPVKKSVKFKPKKLSKKPKKKITNIATTKTKPLEKSKVLTPAENAIEVSKMLKKIGKKPKPLQKEAPNRQEITENKVSSDERDAKIKKYREKIESLKFQTKELKEKVQKKSIEPKTALGGVKVIYSQMQDHKRDIDKEIEKIKALMDYCEKDYLKRKISEKEYRQKMLEYKEKIHILQIEKKDLENQKEELNTTANNIQDVVSVNLDQIANTKNLEQLMIKQQQTLEKIATQSLALQKHQEEAEFAKKKLENVPDSQKINLFLHEKATGKIDEEKLINVEGRLSNLMEKHNISEEDIEREMRKQAPHKVVGSVDKLVDMLELEKKANSAEKIETAMKVSSPIKRIKEIKGIATDVKKHRIITDFDKVLMYILEKGKEDFGKIAKKVGMSRSRVDECCVILQKEGQIEIVYPTIGDPIAQTLDYAEKIALEKMKNKIKTEKR